MTAPTTTRDAAWRATVLTAVREAAEQHGLDPEDLLDSRAFVESLDPLVQLDPDDPALVEGVREAVASATESVEPVTPASDQVPGRVLEARGTDENGGRIFRVRIIDAGDSRNGRRYPHKVLAAAVSKYEGAKAYDHHRTPDELRTSTIAGLVGSYRNVAAVPQGLDGDLHLLPGAYHTAEALDASLAAQAQGLPPLVGISHDVLAHFRPLEGGSPRLMEATMIVKVQSADVVADPSAGGHAVRVVAGGTDDEDQVDYDALVRQERAGLAPRITAAVVEDERDKKSKGLDAFLRGTEGGYRTIREAYLDWTGHRPRYLGEDLNRRILMDSFGTGFDSAMRSTESMVASSWNLALGDSVTRVMVANYAEVPGWRDWKRFTQQAYGLDFRTQRRDRVGGYGILPAVNQGAPYQPLPSPTNEEATYAITKRGGTEDVTLEMIANDDVQAIRRIPNRLGRSASYTLYRFVFDIFTANANTSYDAVALFAAGHGNTDTNALSQTAVSTGRRKMRKQAAYGDTTDVLSIVPRFLVVPSDLEELGWQLVTSMVAIPSTPAGPSDTPNLHHDMELVVVDYYSSTTGWYLVADPVMCPTIEVGFYTANSDPELFTQSDQTVGSMFNADKFTWKLRHIYSGTVIDHRSLYRGNS
jgi:hypothetical protein